MRGDAKAVDNSRFDVASCGEGINKPKITREERTIKSSEFRSILASGKVARGEWLRLRWIPAKDAEQGSTKLGLSVSKRLTGNSVKRNQLRRRLLEEFRRARPKLPAIKIVATLCAKCDDLKSARAAAIELRGLLRKLENRQ